MSDRPSVSDAVIESALKREYEELVVHFASTLDLEAGAEIAVQSSRYDEIVLQMEDKQDVERGLAAALGTINSVDSRSASLEEEAHSMDEPSSHSDVLRSPSFRSRTFRGLLPKLRWTRHSFSAFGETRRQIGRARVLLWIETLLCVPFGFRATLIRDSRRRLALLDARLLRRQISQDWAIELLDEVKRNMRVADRSVLPPALVGLMVGTISTACFWLLIAVQFPSASAVLAALVPLFYIIPGAVALSIRVRRTAKLERVRTLVHRLFDSSGDRSSQAS